MEKLQGRGPKLDEDPFKGKFESKETTGKVLPLENEGSIETEEDATTKEITKLEESMKPSEPEKTEGEPLELDLTVDGFKDLNKP